ncbi:hypothetical protein DS901_14815 [Loktanella sp. D2R18]|uniref:hypothetical protein n=1 Tax=Rhodobacterales TaxID=204455 RepID=UPI000DE9C8F7|nr:MULTISPECIES: hypothetical protein [Rhodobacterales]MDO6588761.1 hypothetical protein [Yoonia sp. 1_MG-2023]RBW42009.1 hypothetical protein DS901_14815 [Loktanella sp. D2R18]
MFNFFAKAATAENAPIAGLDAPEFVAAVDSWLAGDDLIALEALAVLARAENPAAQILLSGIASRGGLHSPVTADLERADRIALLRAPGGLSGRSWLTFAEDTEPLATALLQVTQIREKAPAISVLISAGEIEVALLAAQSMLYLGEADALIEALQGMDALLPPEVDVLLLWALYQSNSGNAGRYAGSARVATSILDNDIFEQSEMVWLPPAPREILEDIERLSDVTRLGRQIASWTPITQFCDNHCGSTSETCIAVGASMLYAMGPFAMRSPRTSIIPNETYWNSPRAEADLARNIVDLRRYEEGTFDSINACFIDEMGALQAEHGYGR